MTELICIKELLQSREAPNHCIGRMETACCVECRGERERGPALEFYRRDLAPGPVFNQPFPEKEREDEHNGFRGASKLKG